MGHKLPRPLGVVGPEGAPPNHVEGCQRVLGWWQHLGGELGVVRSSMMAMGSDRSER